MDYASLINLVLVTVIYSTFVAPGLAKLGAIRDSISEIRFPKNVPPTADDSAPAEAMDEAGELLRNRLNTYRLKYRELKHFLKMFQWIIVGLIYVQLGSLWVAYWQHDPITSGAVISLFTVCFIILLVNRAISAYMVPPYKVRSIKWLANNASIHPVHYRQLMGASLSVEAGLGDIAASVYDVRFEFLLRSYFTGYRYMLTVEKDDGEKLYYVAGGPIDRVVVGGTWYYGDGATERNITLGKTKLKPGDYKVRLLIFESPFMNKDVHAIEKVFSYRLSEEVKPQRKKVGINWLTKNCKYVTFEGEGVKVKAINCIEAGPQEENVIKLLGTGSFNRLLRNSGSMFALSNLNGHIDKPAIIHATTRRNILLRKAKKFFTRKKNLQLS